MAKSSDSVESSRMESSRMNFVFPLLTRSNYNMWAAKMEVFMRSASVWEAIAPTNDAATVDTGKDSKALAMIYQGISEETLMLIAGKKTAKEAWEMLGTRKEMTIKEVIDLHRAYDEMRRLEEPLLQMAKIEERAQFAPECEYVATTPLTLSVCETAPTEEWVTREVMSSPKEITREVMLVEESQGKETVRTHDSDDEIIKEVMLVEGESQRRWEVQLWSQVSEWCSEQTPDMHNEEESDSFVDAFDEAAKVRDDVVVVAVAETSPWHEATRRMRARSEYAMSMSYPWERENNVVNGVKISQSLLAVIHSDKGVKVSALGEWSLARRVGKMAIVEWSPRHGFGSVRPNGDSNVGVDQVHKRSIAWCMDATSDPNNTVQLGSLNVKTVTRSGE